MNEQDLYNEERMQRENLMEPVYKLNPDGTYDLRIGYDYLPKEELMCHEFWRIWREKLARIRISVNEGKYSPVYYYMEKNFMDPFAFAKFIGIPVWKLKRHLKSHIYKRLSPKVIKKYADALDLSVEELAQMK